MGGESMRAGSGLGQGWHRLALADSELVQSWFSERGTGYLRMLIELKFWLLLDGVAPPLGGELFCFCCCNRGFGLPAAFAASASCNTI